MVRAIPIIHRQGPNPNTIEGNGPTSLARPTPKPPKCHGFCKSSIIINYAPNNTTFIFITKPDIVTPSITIRSWPR